MPMNKCPSMPPNPLLPSIFFPQAPKSSCTELSHGNLLCTVFQLFSQPFDSHPTILCPGFPYPPCSSSHLLLGVHTAPFPTEPLSQSRSSSAVVNLSLLEIFDNAEIGSSSLNLWIFSFATDFQSQEPGSFRARSDLSCHSQFQDNFMNPSSLWQVTTELVASEKLEAGCPQGFISWRWIYLTFTPEWYLRRVNWPLFQSAKKKESTSGADLPNQIESLFRKHLHWLGRHPRLPGWPLQFSFRNVGTWSNFSSITFSAVGSVRSWIDHTAWWLHKALTTHQQGQGTGKTLARFMALVLYWQLTSETWCFHWSFIPFAPLFFCPREVIAAFHSRGGCIPGEGEEFLHTDSWTLFNKHKTLILYLDCCKWKVLCYPNAFSGNISPLYTSGLN